MTWSTPPDQASSNWPSWQCVNYFGPIWNRFITDICWHWENLKFVILLLTLDMVTFNLRGLGISERLYRGQGAIYTPSKLIESLFNLFKPLWFEEFSLWILYEIGKNGKNSHFQFVSETFATSSYFEMPARGKIYRLLVHIYETPLHLHHRRVEFLYLGTKRDQGGPLTPGTSTFFAVEVRQMNDVILKQLMSYSVHPLNKI